MKKIKLEDGFISCLKKHHIVPPFIFIYLFDAFNHIILFIHFPHSFNQRWKVTKYIY